MTAPGGSDSVSSHDRNDSADAKLAASSSVESEGIRSVTLDNKQIGKNLQFKC